MTARPAPIASIGLPVYNGARFLRSTLDSLLAQTLADFELLISDNASTDETRAICEQYAARDPRVRYTRQQRNIGAPRNWNFVAEQSRGKYFKWATSNDDYAPTMLAKCVQALEDDPTAVLAQGTTCLVDEETGAREPYTRDLALTQGRSIERLLTLCDKLALNNGQCGVIRSSALRRTRLDRPYPGGDFVLMAELAMLGKFLVLPEVLFYRRMGPATFSRALSGDQLRQFYDPQSSRKLVGHTLRLNLDFLRCVATATMPARDRLIALKLALRRAFWDWSLLFARSKSAREPA